MKVLLRSDVEGVGRRGDIVEVSGGFARNYLLPEGKGLEATKGIEAQATAMRRSRDLRDSRDREAAQAKAEVLNGAVLRIEARAGGTGKLFGSVGPADVVEAARSQKGVELDRHGVDLPEPLKELGSHEVSIQLAPDVTSVITVEVVAAAN
jgi:large subunit ribosomal protein L9